MTFTHESLMKLDRNKLNGLASERGIKFNNKMKKEDLVMLILEYDLENMTSARVPGINTEVIEANQPTVEEVKAEVSAMGGRKPKQAQSPSPQVPSPAASNLPTRKPATKSSRVTTQQAYVPQPPQQPQAFMPQQSQLQSQPTQPYSYQSPQIQQPNTQYSNAPMPYQPQVYNPQVQQPQIQQPQMQQPQMQQPQMQQPQIPVQQHQQYIQQPPQQPMNMPQTQQPVHQPVQERPAHRDASHQHQAKHSSNAEFNSPQQAQQHIDKSRASYFEENTRVYSKSDAGAPANEYRQRGILDIHPDSTFGFLRQREFNLGDDDIYVSQSQIKKFNLRTGDLIEGSVRTPKDQERYPCLVRVDTINGLPLERARMGLPFEKFVPIYPNDRIVLETTQFETSTRLIDLFSPIGRGQRGIIVAKPKAGKTTLLKKIANAVAEFNGQCLSVGKKPIHVIALLIDERPEEVTDFKRSITGEVISSTFDEKPENHIQVAELTLEYAKRKVENGEHVLILLDSLTRLARAYNLTCPSSGKTLTGGLDPNSLHKPKRFLGSARNLENGGSLTIICTALIETGSRLDDIIYEEFKGTANMEVHLDRGMADRRIFPAIDVIKSGTRHEELLYTKPEMDVIWRLRKITADLDEAERLTRLITRLVNTKNNAELLLIIHKAAQG